MTEAEAAPIDGAASLSCRRRISPVQLHQRSLDDAQPCAVAESAEAPKFDRGRCARPFFIEGGARNALANLASGKQDFPVFLAPARGARIGCADAAQQQREKTP